MTPVPNPKVRVRFAKLGKIRWTSHRDVARMWERAFRREQLPLAYSEGFSPRPKVSFGLALPTGHESLAEYLDLELAPEADALDLEALPARLSAALPVGVDVLALGSLEPRTPSLQEDVTSCTWRLAAVPADGCPAVGEDELAARAVASTPRGSASDSRTARSPSSTAAPSASSRSRYSATDSWPVGRARPKLTLGLGENPAV